MKLMIFLIIDLWQFYGVITTRWTREILNYLIDYFINTFNATNGAIRWPVRSPDLAVDRLKCYKTCAEKQLNELKCIFTKEKGVGVKIFRNVTF